MRRESAPSRMFVGDVEAFKRKPEFYDLSTATFITEPAAIELARSEAALNLSGFTEMPLKIAAILASGRSSNLILNGLSRVGSGLVNTLSDYPGQIHLQGVRSIDCTTAKALARCRARAIFLENLCDVEADTMKALASSDVVVISELLKKQAPDVIDGEAATRFIVDQGAICLGAARELTEEGAAALADHSGVLDLTGLKRISDQCAQLLSAHRGPLILNFENLKISINGAEELSRHNPEPHDYKLLIEILLQHKITKECANWLLGQSRQYGTEYLAIHQAKEISDEAAEILASINTRMLHLSSVVRLSDRAAVALSKFQGDVITLDGLQELSMQAAMALTGFKGRLSIEALELMESEEGQLLAKHKQTLQLEQVRLEEINRIARGRATELDRIKREKLAELDAQRSREEKTERDFRSAIRFLDFFKIGYPPEESGFWIVNFLGSFFSGPDQKRDRYRSKIIREAEVRALCMQREQLREYLISRGLGDSDSDFIFAVYKTRYYRVTHCFRCRTHLVSSLSNECPSCGWIRCRCGACGCSYTGRRSMY